MPVVTDYTALLSGDYWNGIEVTGKPVIVTYSFPTTAAAYVANVNGFTAATAGTFQAFNAAEQTEARAALGEWAAASGLVFVEVAPGQGDINFQLVDFNTTSYAGKGGVAFYPFGDWNFFTYPSFTSDLDASGDVFMNTQLVSGGQVAYGTLLHEIGHAIGLKHPTEVVTDSAANPPVTHDQVLASDDPSQTIMATVGDSGTGDHLKSLDQQAAAFLYGAAGTGAVVTANASGSNATSTWSWNATKQVLTQTGTTGDDTLRGSSVSDTINGLDGNDRLFGLNGNDTLNGGAGNDFLAGGPGVDTMKGGTGDDTYLIDNSKDRVIEAAGEGYDSALSSVSYTLAANVDLLQLFGSGLSGHGNDLDNTMYGDGIQATKLYGLGGADYMVGGSGKDTLDGGTGADNMFGGAGNDTYYADNSGDQVNEQVGGGTDTVYASANFTLAPGQEVETVRASGAVGLTLGGNEFDNSLYGTSAIDTLSGGAGNDKLDGRGGADVMSGGDGNDTFYVDNAGDQVNELASGGSDSVYASVSYALGAGQEVETLRSNSSAGLTLSGNELKNTVLGGTGSDTLAGGAGQDKLTGGAGADIFRFNAGDTVAGFDTITDFSTGVDRIDLSVFSGTPAASAYAEIAVASNNFTTLKNAAQAQMTGTVQAVFVAASSNGWLFWNADANPNTAEEAVLLTGKNSLSDFALGDLT